MARPTEMPYSVQQSRPTARINEPGVKGSMTSFTTAKSIERGVIPLKMQDNVARSVRLVEATY